jgi:hypothetical protein
MKIRLPADLRRKIETAARDNNRTMNAEIAVRLDQSFRKEGRVVRPVQSPELEERLARLERFMESVVERIDKMANRLSALEVNNQPSSTAQ